MRLKICNSLFISFVLLFAAVNVLTAQAPVVSKAIGFAISTPVKSFGVAKPEPGKITTRTMVNENDRINRKNEELIKEIIPGLGGKTSGEIQSNLFNVQNLAVPITSFEGNSSQDNFNAYGGRVYPPDVNGDVGPNHYVQTTNLLVGIFDKTTGALVVPKFKMSSLFTALGPPFSTTDAGDPIALYDQLADRWLISQFLFTSISNGVYYQVIAISQTPDPTGAYYLYAFLMPNNKFNDYPHFGVWPDGYYMADNQFTNGGPFSGAGAFAFDRAKMLVGDPSASYIYFDQAASCPTCGGQLPTDLDGAALPPAGAPNLFMEFRADEYGDPYDGLRIFAFHADFATPANSTFTQVGADLPLTAFDVRNPVGGRDIEQPAPSTVTSYLDALADRLMYRLACRILPGGVQSYVGNFTVNVSGVSPTSAATYQAGIKWFELRRSGAGSMSVNNEGIYAPGAGNGATGRNIWMAGIAQDGAGNIGLGFSASSTTLFPSILYTGRLASDPPGMMSQGENTLVLGTGVQLGTANRWGDYSSMSIDQDDCTFWYTQEYYTAASQASSSVGWLTRIGSFKVDPNCGIIACTPPALTATNIGPVNNDPGICGASVTMGSNLTVTGDPVPTVTYSLTNFGATISNPYTFDAGTTTVWAKASNTCGDDIKSFTVTVVDNESPVITCPGNVTVPSDPGVCGAVVNYLAPTVTDNCGGATAPLNISQSTNSTTITPGNSIACTDGISTKEGHYLRKYDLSPMALSGPYTINKINWGVELADPADPFAGGTKISRPAAANSITTNKRSVDNSLAEPGGSNIAQTITLNVYTLTGAFTFANMTLVASQPVVINAQSNTLISTSLSSPPTVPANAVLVLEIYSPDGTAAGTRFFPATNNLGQSGPSYIAAPVCGATQPTDLAGVGFPNVHLILNAEGTVAGTATLTQTVGLSSGSFFPVGTTTNTFETMDAAGYPATCSFTVTVNPGPACCTAVGGTAAGSTTLCGSGTPTITASGYSTGSSSYQWYSSTVLADYPNGGSAISGETNPASLNAGAVSTTTYFWLRVSCPGNTSSDNSTLVTVIVNPLPEAVATPSSQTICTGSAITPIVLSGNVPATVYNWTRDNLGVTGIAANGAGDISGLLTNTTADPVTVTFTITPTGNGCTGDPVTATVTVNPANYFVCPGDMFETINDIICFKAVNTPNPVFCGVLTRLTWKLTGATVLSSPTSGINYLGLRNMNVGVTTVTYTAKAAGNITRTCSFKVTVIETIEPYIRCPFDVDVNTDAGKCYKTGPVNLGTPVTSDNCGVASVTNDAPAVYQKGVNLVTWTVTDKSGNTRTCIQRVTVYDVQKPTLQCPANVIAYTGPDCTATPVTLPYPTFSDNCGVVKLTWAMVGVTWGQSPNTGINYVPTMNYVTGVSTVTYTATDESGNAIACSFTVTVKDVTPPTLTCPPAQTFCKVGNNVYSVPALIQEDNCVIALTTYKITGATSRVGSGTNASGVFNMGVSTIKWTVKDVNGNSSTCSSIVTVVATSNPVCNPLPLTGPVTEGNPKFTEASVSELSITAWPNPSVDYFNLKVTSPAKDAVEIRLFDMSGKLVQFKRGAPGDIYLIGDNVVSGMYIVEVRQGSKTVRTRLVKHN